MSRVLNIFRPATPRGTPRGTTPRSQAISTQLVSGLPPLPVPQRRTEDGNTVPQRRAEDGNTGAMPLLLSMAPALPLPNKDNTILGAVDLGVRTVPSDPSDAAAKLSLPPVGDGSAAPDGAVSPASLFASAEAPLSAKKRWDWDVGLMRHGIKRFFLNDWKTAEDLCSTGFDAPPPYAYAAGEEPSRDLRGAYAMLSSQIALVRGVAELTDGQLAIALPRLKVADTLLSSSEAWIGQRLLRAFCALSYGLCLIAQQHFMKGAWKIFTAFLTIRKIHEADMLEFPAGQKESLMIRSAGQLVLGLLYQNMALMPPIATRWVGEGPGLERGLELLRECVKGDGIAAVFAANVLLAYFVAVKQVNQAGFEPMNCNPYQLGQPAQG